MIRQIIREEVPQCVQLIRDSFLTVAEELGFSEENAPRFTAFATNAERLHYQLDQEHREMLGFYVDHQIVGYYSLHFLQDGECELNNLCVHPGSRHRKIGEVLLRDAFSRAKEKGCTKMKIGIVEENWRLRSWYEKHGFRHVGTEKFDFFPFTCGYMEFPFTGVG